jgi:hypothetical protein
MLLDADPTKRHFQSWKRYKLGGQHVAVRTSGADAPREVSAPLRPYSVLQLTTVSARFSPREHLNVWTSRNRAAFVPDVGVLVRCLDDIAEERGPDAEAPSISDMCHSAHNQLFEELGLHGEICE